MLFRFVFISGKTKDIIKYWIGVAFIAGFVEGERAVEKFLVILENMFFMIFSV